MEEADMSTTMIEGTTVDTVTVIPVRAEYLRSLACAAVAAGKDDTLPTLTGVRLEWGPGYLRAVATDRYRLAIIEHHAEETGSAVEGSALVPAKEFVAYVKTLPKPTRYGLPAVVMVKPGDGEVTFTCTSPDGEVTRTIRTLVGEFPRYDKLVPTEFGALPAEGIAMNPQYVADVAKMPVGKNTPVRVQFTAPNRPMVWRAGSKDEGLTWKYLLMPTRLAG
jgi:DNA polymerase-3 subunit beta